MSYHGALTAAHAARKRRLQQQQDEKEEVEMTDYTQDDLENNWEFKIVRSESGAFRKPQNFQQLLREEEISGWELMEKLDDRRVRFKRSKDARVKDMRLPPGIDPYRSHFGTANRSLVLVLVGLISVLVLGAGLVFFGLESSGGDVVFDSSITIVANIAIIGIVLLLMLAAFFTRLR